MSVHAGKANYNGSTDTSVQPYSEIRHKFVLSASDTCRLILKEMTMHKFWSPSNVHCQMPFTSQTIRKTQRERDKR